MFYYTQPVQSQLKSRQTSIEEHKVKVWVKMTVLKKIIWIKIKLSVSAYYFVNSVQSEVRLTEYVFLVKTEFLFKANRSCMCILSEVYLLIVFLNKQILSSIWDFEYQISCHLICKWFKKYIYISWNPRK